MSEQNELVVYSGGDLEQQRFMPVMALSTALDRRQIIVDATKKLMQDGVDFGTIPGAGDRPTLKQPGADKLCNLFGLVIKYEILEQVKDWTGADHYGEPFFYVEVKGRAFRGDVCMGEGIGSCSSWESKYRYRQSDRKCPQCGKENIKKSKQGGWYCWAKLGGCGATFHDGDQSIESQEVGRKANPDVFDQLNTVQKMAFKRCLGGACPIFIRVAGKVSRGTIEGLYLIWEKATKNTLQIPGTDGSWREVKGMLREDNREAFRIQLSDYSVITATPEHQFPTTRGLLDVAELKVGDCLLRSRICIPDGKADLKAAWISGFFLAEGCYAANDTTVLFSLHRKEAEYVERIKDYAESLGCTVTVGPHGENGVTVTVSGPAFRGVMQTFIDGKAASGKSISRRAWRQGTKFLDELLDGYLCGDGSESQRPGHSDKWMLGFTGKNTDLAEDLRAICAVLGYRCSLKRTNARFKGVDFPAYKGWISREQTIYNEKELNTITSIEKADRLLAVYDVEVDGDHLFCLANGIHSHNCKVSTTINATSASEFFTQDVEDQPAEEQQPPAPLPKRRSTWTEGKKAQQEVLERKMRELERRSDISVPVPVAAPFVATDDDLPASLGGSFEPQPNPAEQLKANARAAMSGNGEAKPWRTRGERKACFEAARGQLMSFDDDPAMPFGESIFFAELGGVERPDYNFATNQDALDCYERIRQRIARLKPEALPQEAS